MSGGGDGVSAAGPRIPGGQEREPILNPGIPHPTAHEPNWPLLYGLVLCELVILIALFHVFTKAFA